MDFLLEFQFKGPQTELQTLSQNCEPTLPKLRTNRIMNKRAFLWATRGRKSGRKFAWNLTQMGSDGFTTFFVHMNRFAETNKLFHSFRAIRANCLKTAIHNLYSHQIRVWIAQVAVELRCMSRFAKVANQDSSLYRLLILPQDLWSWQPPQLSHPYNFRAIC